MLRFFKEGNKFARFLNVWLKLTQGVERLFLVLLFFIFFSHIGACIWYLQADLSESPTSWIMRDEEATKDNVFYVSFFIIKQKFSQRFTYPHYIMS